MWAPFIKMTFAYYLAHQNFFDLLSMGAVQIFAQVVHSMAI